MVTMTRPQSAEAPAGPKPSAIQRYREAVFAAVDNGRDDIDLATLADGWKLLLDFQADLKVYRSRLAAAGDLDKRVPELHAVANRLAEVAAAPAAVGSRHVSDYPTVRDLLYALNECARHATAGAVSPEKLAASQAAAEVGRVRHAATALLRETADPAIGRQIGELFTQVASLDAAIHGRQEILNVGSEITRCEAKISQYAADDRTFNAEPAATRRVSSTELYLRERKHLEELRVLASQRPDALAENEADAARIVELWAQINALELRRLEPQNMQWHE